MLIFTMSEPHGTSRLELKQALYLEVSGATSKLEVHIQYVYTKLSKFHLSKNLLFVFLYIILPLPVYQ